MTVILVGMNHRTASVELREVMVGDDETDSAWIAADGTRYALVPGGLAQRVK